MFTIEGDGFLCKLSMIARRTPHIGSTFDSLIERGLVIWPYSGMDWYNPSARPIDFLSRVTPDANLRFVLKKRVEMTGRQADVVTILPMIREMAALDLVRVWAGGPPPLLSANECSEEELNSQKRAINVIRAVLVLAHFTEVPVDPIVFPRLGGLEPMLAGDGLRLPPVEFLTVLIPPHLSSGRARGRLPMDGIVWGPKRPRTHLRFS